MNPKRPAIVWTDKKLALIREYYPTMFNDALAKWIGCSMRTLQRKAVELGIRKVDNFNQVRAEGMAERISAAQKKSYAEGRRTSRFKKGERPMPEYEFKPGHRFGDDIEKERISNIRRTYRKRKLLKIYGLTQ